LALVALAMSTASPTWSEWPWVMRIRSTFFSSARSFFADGLSGLEIHGSISNTRPSGVTTRNAAGPYQVSRVFGDPATSGGISDEAFCAAAASEVQQSKTAKTRARCRFKRRFLQAIVVERLGPA